MNRLVFAQRLKPFFGFEATRRQFDNLGPGEDESLQRFMPPWWAAGKSVESHRDTKCVVGRRSAL